jgi:hypothetical protein
MQTLEGRLREMEQIHEAAAHQVNCKSNRVNNDLNKKELKLFDFFFFFQFTDPGVNA